jgi:hypothetical protein
VVVLLVAGPAPALGASGGQSERRVVDDDWVLSIGGYLTEFRTDASVGSGSVFGTTIRAEDDLGIDDDQSVVRVSGFHRFNDRHALGFGAWSLNRDGNATIDDQIEFEGNLFDVGADLSSRFDTGWLRVDWQYSLMRTDRGEAGFKVGISAYQFDLKLDGQATVSDGAGGTILEEVRAAEDLLAPVPTVGMFINYAFRPNLVLRVHADFFDLEVSDLEGRLVDTTFQLEWYFSRRVGVGFGAQATDIDFRDAGGDPIAIDFRQSGLLGYLTIAF